MFPRPEFFRGAKLNFARNLLYPVLDSRLQPISDDDIAIISATESTNSQMNWGELRKEVRKCANALRPFIGIGDRVAGFLGNHALTVVAMLATTSLGGIWTAVSPDAGVAAVLDSKYGRIFACNKTVFDPKLIASSSREPCNA